MSLFDPQPEDSQDILEAKKFISIDFPLQNDNLSLALGFLTIVINDRSDWIAKISEINDTMIDVVSQITPRNKYESELMSIMSGQATEVSAMLRPPKKQVAFGQRK